MAVAVVIVAVGFGVLLIVEVMVSIMVVTVAEMVIMEVLGMIVVVALVVKVVVVVVSVIVVVLSMIIAVVVLLVVRVVVTLFGSRKGSRKVTGMVAKWMTQLLIMHTMGYQRMMKECAHTAHQTTNTLLLMDRYALRNFPCADTLLHWECGAT